MSTTVLSVRRKKLIDLFYKLFLCLLKRLRCIFIICTNKLAIFFIFRDNLIVDFFYCVDEDEPLFISLVADLFPNQQLEKTCYPELEEAVQQHVDEIGLIYHAPWVLKIIQVILVILFVVIVLSAGVIKSDITDYVILDIRKVILK